MSALTWTPFAFVVFVATLPIWRLLWTLTENLPDRLGESNLPDIVRWSAAPILAGFGLAAFWGIGLGGGTLAPGFPTVPAEAAGPPNAPIIQSITGAGDSVTFRVTMSAFAGSQDDTHDSTRILVDSAGKDFTSPLVDSVTGPQTSDTISHAFAHSAVYDFVALYRGADGGWSDTSNVAQQTVTFAPEQITTLSVSAQTDSSLTIQWVTVNDGQGEKANHSIRYKNVTGDTASFVWWGTQESASEVFDSAGTNIGDTVIYVVPDLLSGNTYEFGIKAYSGTPNVDATYGATSNTASGTTVGTPAQDTTDTPTLTLTATADTNSIQMNGSGFSGGNQTHDSTRWKLDNNSDMSSPFHDVTSASDLTSHLVTDNANLDADATYYGTVQYFGSSDASQVSAVDSVVNTAPSGDYPNEPAGFTVVRTWDGSALVPSGWVEVGPNQDVKHSKVDTAGLPSGNPALYRHTYPGNNPNIGGSGTEYLGSGTPRFYQDATAERIYIHFYIRPDANWDGHSSTTNKVIYWGADTPHHMFFRMHGKDDGPLRPGITAQNLPEDNSTFAWKDEDSSIPRGQWTRVEILVNCNTLGNENGTFKVWLDGTLVLDESGAGKQYRWAEDRDEFMGAKTDAIWGGIGDELSADQVLDMDDIRISVGPR